MTKTQRNWLEKEKNKKRRNLEAFQAFELSMLLRCRRRGPLDKDESSKRTQGLRNGKKLLMTTKGNESPKESA